ncbi:FHA domain-containing protein [Streptomyces sp. NBC_00078]|uniref:FHA domain-containing protein n=1 Tax=unclassified Streptomyces TaxID=2593676 RepID=UPI00224CEBC6|nr:FHA domain-containing protein [Streptomyces sp. NBC_00078]MCX5420547.1 FHA domain-containing protein [Streptomyces sp. NBC_00078]
MSANGRPGGPAPGRMPPSGRPLAATHGSLARGASAPLPGTVFALAITGGITLGPGEGREVLFGRNRPEVHVCLAEDDPQVSRHQGTLAHRAGSWWLSTTGRLPIRCPGSRLLFRGEDPLPLVPGYSPLFIGGSRGREHLLEVYVTGPEGERPLPRHADVTRPPRVWTLTEPERLALIVLGRRYLLHEPRPQPLTWRQTATQLAELQLDFGWTDKRVEHLVNGVRLRLSRDGVPWLTREEIGEPVGNALNDHLIRALMSSTTLVPMDLVLIDAA